VTSRPFLFAWRPADTVFAVMLSCATLTKNEEALCVANNENGTQDKSGALSVCWLGDLVLAFGVKPAKADYKIACRYKGSAQYPSSLRSKTRKQ
jgi:hypothetical protein